jgi:hypothetical protein
MSTISPGRSAAGTPRLQPRVCSPVGPWQGLQSTIAVPGVPFPSVNRFSELIGGAHR